MTDEQRIEEERRTAAAAHLAQRMAEITSAEGLKTMTQNNAFVARMVGK